MPSVLVLGATGIIGLDVSLAFLAKGYKVYGLARTQQKANYLSKNEIIPVLANGKQVDKWQGIAETVDVVVEAIADYQDWDTQASVMQCLKSLATKRPNLTVIYTSGIWVYGSNTDDTMITEETPYNAPQLTAGRIPVEQEYTSFGAIIIQASLVYGRAGAHSATYFRDITRGFIRLFNSPQQYQSYIHAIDMAQMYVLAAEHASSVRGQIFIASAHCERISDIVAAATSKRSESTLITYSPPTDGLEECLALSQRASSGKAERLLGWKSTQPSLSMGIDRYFHSWEVSNAESPYQYSGAAPAN
eukprot:gene4025-4662_t